MSSSESKSRENSPNRPSRTASQESASHKPHSKPANVIEFVDSQDKNVKSTIQRHTAYHSAAQRREARLRSLRRGSQPRYLEWSRREVPPTNSPTSSASSLSISPVDPLVGTEPSSASQAAAHDTGPTSPVDLPSRSTSLGSETTLGLEGNPQRTRLTLNEESVIQSYLERLRRRSQIDHSADAMIAFMCTDEACTQLLLAYCYALLSTSQESSGSDDHPDTQAAQQAFGRGTNTLWNRLREPSHASSDVNIQAVLLLVAFTADFGSRNEVDIHIEALRTMVTQRGGLEALHTNQLLQQQLHSLSNSRKLHLTFPCETGGGQPLRFPFGSWSGQFS